MSKVAKMHQTPRTSHCRDDAISISSDFSSGSIFSIVKAASRIGFPSFCCAYGVRNYLGGILACLNRYSERLSNSRRSPGPAPIPYCRGYRFSVPFTATACFVGQTLSPRLSTLCRGSLGSAISHGVVQKEDQFEGSGRVRPGLSDFAVRNRQLWSRDGRQKAAREGQGSETVAIRWANVTAHKAPAAKAGAGFALLLAGWFGRNIWPILSRAPVPESATPQWPAFVILHTHSHRLQPVRARHGLRGHDL